MNDRSDRTPLQPQPLNRARRLGGATAHLHAGIDRLPETLRRALQHLPTIGDAPLRVGRAPRTPATGELVPDGGRFIAGVHRGHAGSRAYKLYVPSGDDGRRALPLIVMLHGCTQTPDDFAAGTRMNLLAEARTCFVVYPEHDRCENASRCWNWFNADDQHRDRGEPSLIAGITREVMRDHPVDARRVYVAGLSAGAAAAVVLGRTYPDLFAAVGAHSGLPYGAARDLPSAFAAMQNGAAVPRAPQRSGEPGACGRTRFVPTIVFHGDRDATVHPANGEQIVAQAAASAALRATAHDGRVPGGHAYRCTRYADANGRSIVEHWVIHGAGHAWSGGSLAGSHTDPHGPDAAREMLRFFLEQTNAEQTNAEQTNAGALRRGSAV